MDPDIACYVRYAAMLQASDVSPRESGQFLMDNWASVNRGKAIVLKLEKEAVRADVRQTNATVAKAHSRIFHAR